MSGISGEFKVEGFKELAQTLLDVAEAGGVKALRPAQWKASLVIRDEAKARCPVDTGRLQEFLGRGFGRTEGVSDTRYASLICVGIVSMSKIRLGKKGLTSGAWYGRFVEMGTRFMRAQPFLGPAFDVKKEAYTEVLRQELGNEIDKRLRKAGVKI